MVCVEGGGTAVRIDDKGQGGMLPAIFTLLLFTRQAIGQFLIVISSKSGRFLDKLCALTCSRLMQESNVINRNPWCLVVLEGT